MPSTPEQMESPDRRQVPDPAFRRRSFKWLTIAWLFVTIIVGLCAVLATSVELKHLGFIAFCQDMLDQLDDFTPRTWNETIGQTMAKCEAWSFTCYFTTARESLLPDGFMAVVIAVGAAFIWCVLVFVVWPQTMPQWTRENRIALGIVGFPFYFPVYCKAFKWLLVAVFYVAGGTTAALVAIATQIAALLMGALLVGHAIDAYHASYAAKELNELRKLRQLTKLSKLQ